MSELVEDEQSPAELAEMARVSGLAKAKVLEVPPPCIVDRYDLERHLGHGAVGSVYRAYDRRLRRSVALKFIPDDSGPLPFGSHPSCREALLLAQLEHPSIVPVYDVDKVGPELFIAMGYVHGQTLEKWASERHRTWTEALQIFRQVGAGLVAAHDVGLLHGDLSPRNVMLGANGRPVILDFGLARELGLPRDPPYTMENSGDGNGEGHSNRTRKGGTPGYVAPERYVGKGDEKSDQFSFCACFLRVILGVQPFSEDVAHHELRKRVRDHRGIPRWLGVALLRGVEPQASRRFGSMSELLAALGPPRSRARILMVTVVSATVGAAAMFRFVPQELPCLPDDAPLLQSWNEDARTSLRARFADADRPQHVFHEKMIDAFVAQWMDLRNDTCRAARSRDLLEPLASLRTTCLRQARDRVRDLLSELRVLERPRWNRIVDVVAEVTDLSECRDEDLLLVRAPSGREDQELADAIHRRLDAGHIQLLLGRLDTQLELLEAAHAELADPVRSPRATAWLRVQLGAAFNQNQRFEAAEEVLRTVLLEVVRDGTWRLEHGLSAAQLAEAVIGRNPSRFPEAVLLGEQAVAVLDGDPRTRHYVGLAHRALAIALYHANRPRDGLAHLERALATLSEQTQTQMRLRAFAPVQERIARASIFNVQGLLNERIGQREDARRSYASALDELANVGTMPLEPIVHNNLGLLEKDLGNLGAAAVSLQRAAELHEAFARPLAASQSWSNLGNVQLETKDFDASMVSYGRAVALLERAEIHGVPEWLARYNVAAALDEAGRFDEAAAQCEPLLALLRDESEPTQGAIAHECRGILARR